MKKFWTVKDGVIGTAHNSRDGRVVDFRECGQVHPGSGGTVEVRPGNGVVIAPLVLPGVMSRREPLPEGQKCGWVTVFVDAIFEGVTVTATRQEHFSLLTPEEAKAMLLLGQHETAKNLELQRSSKENKSAADEMFQRVIGQITVEQVLSSQGKFAVQKLRSGDIVEMGRLKNLMANIALSRVLDAFPMMNQPARALGSFSFARVDTQVAPELIDHMAKQLIEVDQRVRDAKKAAYLATKNNN